MPSPRSHRQHTSPSTLIPHFPQLLLRSHKNRSSMSCLSPRNAAVAPLSVIPAQAGTRDCQNLTEPDTRLTKVDNGCQNLPSPTPSHSRAPLRRTPNNPEQIRTNLNKPEHRRTPRPDRTTPRITPDTPEKTKPEHRPRLLPTSRLSSPSEGEGRIWVQGNGWGGSSAASLRDGFAVLAHSLNVLADILQPRVHTRDGNLSCPNLLPAL